jgi:hypothetical protein
VIQNLLKSTCKIKGLTETRSTADSSVAASFATYASGIAIDIQADTSRESMQYMKDTGRTRLRCYTQTNSILHGDRLEVTAGWFTGNTVEVVSLPFDTAGRGNHKVVICEYVKTGGAS